MVRWVACSVVALAVLGQGARSSADAQHKAFVCPATAKPANFNFTLKDLNNADVPLASLKGKVVLLDFWATWCGPCKVEIPWFVDFQTRYGRDGVQVVGIAIDDQLPALKSYAAQFKMNYPVLQARDGEAVVEAFGPMIGLPTTLVISRAGRICATHTGLTSRDVFDAEIQALLAERR